MEKADIYCERVDPSFWAEPLNAITNAAFIVAALICWRVAAREGRQDALTLILILNLIAIGVGSFLWHTFAESWAGAADTIPILTFILIYLYAATLRFLGQPLWVSLAAPVGFILFAIGFLFVWTSILPSVNGSEGYFPVLILLIGFGLLLYRRQHPAATSLIAAAALFSLSLTFRSVDEALCHAIPIGTHIWWHMLNGVLLGIVLMAFVRHGARAS
ncbi:MAG: ceramidase domain-containing protein [Pseudomonadota bacterium]